MPQVTQQQAQENLFALAGQVSRILNEKIFCDHQGFDLPESEILQIAFIPVMQLILEKAKNHEQTGIYVMKTTSTIRVHV